MTDLISKGLDDHKEAMINAQKELAKYGKIINLYREYEEQVNLLNENEIEHSEALNESIFGMVSKKSRSLLSNLQSFSKRVQHKNDVNEILKVILHNQNILAALIVKDKND